MFRAFAGFAALAFTAAATAQLTDIAPFTGGITDDFESYDDYVIAGNFDTLAVSGGAATFGSNPTGSGQLWIIDPAGGATWGLADYGTAGTNSGRQALGFYNSGTLVDVYLDFTDPVIEVGFWYVTASVSGDSDMDVEFFDAVGDPIDTGRSLDSGGSTYLWAGWSSTVPIHSMRFSGNVAPVVDDLQANVPEPTTLLSLLAGVALVAARRR